MANILEEIGKADEVILEEILKAALQRHKELFPDWEMSTIRLQKHGDKNEQLDKIIAFLQNMKNLP